MKAKPRTAHLGDEHGFTLLELGVSLLVIAVLVTMSLGAFRGAARAGELSSIRLRVTTALKAEMAMHVSSGVFLGTATEVRRATLTNEEPSLDWGSTSATNDQDVIARAGRLVVAGTMYRQAWVCLEAVSPAGDHVAVAKVAIGPASGTYYGHGTTRLCRGLRSVTAWPTSSW